MADRTNAAASINVQQLATDLAAASGRPIDNVAQSLVNDLAFQVATFARAYAPVRTGRLKNSIQVLQGTGGISAVVRPNTSYSGYVEFGTGTRGEFPGQAWTIRPRNPQGVLVFKIGNKTVYAKSVRHPGSRPFPYMRPAAERVATPLVDGLGNAAVVMIVKGPNAPASLAIPVPSQRTNP